MSDDAPTAFPSAEPGAAAGAERLAIVAGGAGSAGMAAQGQGDRGVEPDRPDRNRRHFGAVPGFTDC